ncbi:MAG: thiamine phosphate synthase [Alcanivorax sp.]|uniref:Thiamine-phosphate synthase n=1 Tax=Alloalcanivorax marinus TaxID=1177169 RepID=A0A9Q3UQI6_9GAMM|nr:thiamine phosphate synthase [Alloalcanivorax marinus]MCC4310256.1 thiamine phosphate synthase [Alloalcanivorax marinus]
MNRPDASRVRGLYAITDPRLTPGDSMLSAAEAALRGGASMLQYRDKHADTATRRHRAARLALLCQDHGALFIVNDDAALAAEVEADGVHLGQSDGAVDSARRLLGSDKLIGVSCHGRLELAQKAADEGADYLALGRFFDSRTKPEAPPATLETLRRARRRFHQPLVAIGGVNAHNAGQLIEAGADAVAVIHALFGLADPADVTHAGVEAAARQLAGLFNR